MSSEPGAASGPATAFDQGLLAPVAAGHDDVVSDAAVVDALVAAEIALVRAHVVIGVVDDAVAARVSAAFGGEGDQPAQTQGISAAELAVAARSGGNPVIPLVTRLRAKAGDSDARWIHRGATSQDILDTALMLVGSRAVARILTDLDRTAQGLEDFAQTHAATVAAARTLTQQAVPTSLGARAAGWSRGIRRAAGRLRAAADALPAQLGGAAGTLAATVDEFGEDAATRLVAAFAADLGLRTPHAPWHTERWPVTELGDALVQVLDALGKLATDVATLSRTEIAELHEGSGGGSSAMPHKRNPAHSVLIRSAALRAPQLGATLHLAAALAGDERPDGAWHAEWPTLRELLRLALGASAHAADLADGLVVDDAAVSRNLTLTGGLIVSERLRGVLVPLIGAERFAALVASTDGTLDARVRALPEAADLDLDDLLDPAQYIGLAADLARATAEPDAEGKTP